MLIAELAGGVTAAQEDPPDQLSRQSDPMHNLSPIASPTTLKFPPEICNKVSSINWRVISLVTSGMPLLKAMYGWVLSVESVSTNLIAGLVPSPAISIRSP